MRTTLFFLLTFVAAMLFGTGAGSGTMMDWYDDAWAKVDSLDRQGLPKSALETVDTIYDRARADKNEPHLIKSLLYRSRYRMVLEEDSEDAIFAELNENLDVLSDSSRAVLHSIIGELYWQYLQTNRYQFYNRTTGGAPDSSSIQTWDLRKIVATALEHYRASIAARDLLSTIDVRSYDPIVSLGDDSRDERPTLFDFLAHRALDVLQNGESSLTQPVNPFRLNAERDLAPADAFVGETFATPDSLSMQAETLRILQSLIALHLDDGNNAALVHSDLRRLQYVRSQLSGASVLTLFEQRLEELSTEMREYPSWAEVRYTLAREKANQGAQYNPLEGSDHKWDRKAAHEMCTEAIEAFPTSRGASSCRALNKELTQRELQVEARGVVVPDAEFPLRLSFRNVPKAYVKVVALSRDEVRDWRFGTSEVTERLIARLVSRDAVFSDEVTLPVDGDLQQHSTVTGISALPMGQYAVLVGSASDFNTEEEVRFIGLLAASRLSYVERREPSGVNRLYVLDRDTGHPLEDVRVVGWNRMNQVVAPVTGSAQTSDANGMVVFANVGQRFDTIELSLGDDWLLSYSGLYPNRQNYRAGAYNETRFFTDRSIYRPGQTIYFKGILLTRSDEHYSIRGDAKTRVVFRDVNYQEIAALDLVSNEYGTVAGEFVAPRGVLTGMMTIEDPNGSVSVSVEEYKRPRFEVTVDPVTASVALGDSITITGKAMSLAGAAIGDGAVRYRVSRSLYFPMWGYWRWRPWPRAETAEIAFGDVGTNPDGTYSFAFEATADPSIDPDTHPVYTYSVSVDVTDIAGETRSASTTVSAGYDSVLLTLSVPESADADAGISFTPGATNINGEGIPFEGEVTVTPLRKPGLLLEPMVSAVDTLVLSAAELRKIDPYGSYGDAADPSTWKRDKPVLQRAVSGDGSTTVSTDGRVRWEPGTYEVRFTSADDRGRALETTRYMTVYASRDDEAPEQTLDWFALMTPRVEPGENARYLIGTSERNVRVLVELERDGEIIESNWVRLSREQKELTFPVVEAYRGNVALHVTFAWKNRVFRRSQIVNVPWSNKDLSMKWETFRSKLYPGQDETWKLRIAGPKGDAVAAEMVATLYDASLDALRPHNWSLSLWPVHGVALYWNTSEFQRDASFRRDGRDWNDRYAYPGVSYDALNWFGFSWWGGRRGVYYKSMRMDAPMAEGVVMESAAPMAGRAAADGLAMDAEAAEVAPQDGAGADKQLEAEAPATVRKNLNETAFFFPQLHTDADGSITLSFTMPEALTRWHFMGLAITEDLKIGSLQGETVTQKELMVTPNAPRFFREGDTIVFTAKVDNLSETDLSGYAEIEFEDAVTGEPVTNLLGLQDTRRDIAMKSGQSAPVEWTLSIPQGISAVTYRVKATTDQFADGEEAIVPVLTNRMLVTESLPLPMRGPGTRTFTFDKLKNEQSSTRTNERFTLEYSPNPIWYAVQALPYLMEFPHECAEQVFSRIYANGIAWHITEQQPRLRSVYNSWKDADAGALVSNLEKNQELKAVLLEETPWVLQAKNETERKRRIGVLFDAFRMRGELSGAIAKLEQMQRGSGAFPWFDGMEDNRFITQHIVKGFGYMRRIGVLETLDDGRPVQMATRAIAWLDQELIDD
ncbi:MAG: hypothetical protein KDD65_15635, partial [Bacteroidetes bacterium]|nr:hypothetical protein [Bacteroidota bacterium]